MNFYPETLDALLSLLLLLLLLLFGMSASCSNFSYLYCKKVEFLGKQILYNKCLSLRRLYSVYSIKDVRLKG